jgi:hypothetical protein
MVLSFPTGRCTSITIRFPARSPMKTMEILFFRPIDSAHEAGTFYPTR